jgi:type IV pilus assembly protein PilE
MSTMTLPAIQRARGFTLVELMVSVLIVGILAGVALPGYRQYVVRGNRSAAQSAMLDLANRQQQMLLANRAYADTNQLRSSGYVLPPEVGQNYSWVVTVGTGTVPSFVITLTAIGGQSGDGPLTLDNSGNKTPAGKWQG